MKKLIHNLNLIIVATSLIIAGCKKDKIDNNADIEEVGGNEASSGGPSVATIKVRIVNRMEQISKKIEDTRYTDTLENLYGPVTLVYADGTPVGSQTTNVKPGTASEYIEIPYGTYQFKLLTSKGRQIPADERGTGYNMFDPASSLMYSNNPEEILSALTYAPVQTYHPGGIYSITVRPNAFNLSVPGFPPIAEATQNQFLITADETVIGNTKYGRMQAVNAFSSDPINFKLSGQIAELKAAYGKATEYVISDKGTQTVAAFDASGNLLAKTEAKLDAGQNLSFWLWPAKDGKAELLAVYNDLSNTYFYYSDPENGQANLKSGDMLPTAIRFLNLCANEPYISFTVDNGGDARKHIMAKGSENTFESPTEQVVYNLQPGVPVTEFPYTRWTAEYNRAFDFTVFRSKPGLIPGVWAQDIGRLASSSFVARPQLYTDGKSNIPKMEPGFYTVALITNTALESKSMMIIVKHNR